MFDEPTAGLDPKERVKFRNLIAEIGKNAVVILSTHIVSDIEDIADRVIIMKDGSVIYNDVWNDEKGDLEAFFLDNFDEEGKADE